MRINFVLPSIGTSGGIDVVNQYADTLSILGHDVVIYKEILSPNMHRYRSPLKNMAHRIWCSLKAIKGVTGKGIHDQYVFKISGNNVRNADAIIATSWPTAYEVSSLPENLGKKWYFIQGFEVWDNKELGIESYKLPLNKVVVSSWINNRLREELDIGPFPVIYNGIDTSMFNDANRTKHNGITFLMLNHTLEKKGIRQGLEAYNRIHRLYPNTKLRMFGMCSNENLPNEVEYHQDPSKDLLVSLYKDTDIFIYPSLEEGWGLTPIEAMACGCAVVGTRTGFVLDIGRHGENMMISEPGDVEGMVKNIDILMNDRDMIDNISNAGIRTTEQLSWSESAELFLRLLQKGDR